MPAETVDTYPHSPTQRSTFSPPNEDRTGVNPKKTPRVPQKLNVPTKNVVLPKHSRQKNLGGQRSRR